MNGEQAIDARTRAPIGLWRNRDFVLLEGGQAVSALGTSISKLAFLLLALDLTHSPAQAGFIAGSGALPFLVLALPAGAWADRWDRRRVLMLCDAGRALILASIPVALLLSHLTVVQLYLAALAEGALAALFTIAGTASLPRVVEKRQLTQATSVDYTLRSTVMLAGPSLSGLLYSAVQALPFLADAVSYVVSVLSLRWMRVRFQDERPQQTTRHLGREILAGTAWLWRQPVLRFQLLAGCVLSFALYPNALLVTFLAQRQHASATVIGLIFTLAAIGALIGSPAAPLVQRALGFGPVIAGMFWGLALLWPLYVLSPNLVVLGLITAGIFCVDCVGSIINAGYRLALTPDEYQGRVNSLYRLVGFGIGQPLGWAVVGLLLQRFDPRISIVASAGVLALTALAATLYRPVRLAPRLT